jgi:hypothetical protein
MNMHVNATSAAAVPSGASVLSQRAVLAFPSIAVWTARRFDRAASAGVTDAARAASDAARVNKLLIPTEAMSDVTAAAGRARDYHYARTLAWSDAGARILPVVSYADYQTAMRGFRAEFEIAVSGFLSRYPALVAAAAERMGDLFDPADYPDVSEIADRFRFKVSISPVPSGADFRVDIGDAIRADVEDRVREATGAAMAEAAGRVAELVRTMADKLAAFQPAVYGPDGKIATPATGIFRDSLIGNVRDIAAVLPSFNLTDSPEFGAMVSAVEALAAVDPADLREDGKARREMADRAAALAREAETIASNAAAFF